MTDPDDLMDWYRVHLVRKARDEVIAYEPLLDENGYECARAMVVTTLQVVAETLGNGLLGASDIAALARVIERDGGQPA